jgi:hypothetical protein
LRSDAPPLLARAADGPGNDRRPPGLPPARPSRADRASARWASPIAATRLAIAEPTPRRARRGGHQTQTAETKRSVSWARSSRRRTPRLGADRGALWLSEAVLSSLARSPATAGRRVPPGSGRRRAGRPVGPCTGGSGRPRCRRLWAGLGTQTRPPARSGRTHTRESRQAPCTAFDYLL